MDPLMVAVTAVVVALLSVCAHGRITADVRAPGMPGGPPGSGGGTMEYGAPQELLRVPGGAFAALAARAGVGFPQTRIVSMQSS